VSYEYVTESGRAFSVMYLFFYISIVFVKKRARCSTSGLALVKKNRRKRVPKKGEFLSIFLERISGI